MRTNGVWKGLRKFECARCGFDYPVTYRRWQHGLAVCTYIPCYDTPKETDLGSPGKVIPVSWEGRHDGN